jgi:hypothetical protein
MGAIQDWMTRRSGPELFFVTALFWVVVFGLVELASGARINFIALGASGALFGLFMTALTLSARKRAGGADLMIAMNDAIRTGELPPLFNITLWIDKLESRRAALQRAVVVNPVFFGLLSLLLLAVALLSRTIDWSSLALAVLSAAVGVAWTVSARRRLPKIVELQRQISGLNR